VIVGGTLVIGHDRFGAFHAEVDEQKIDFPNKFPY